MNNFSHHSEVKSLLRSQKQRQSFDRLMNHIVGIAVHNGHDLNEPFPIPSISLKPYHYDRFKKPLSIFIERVGGYARGENGEKGKCFNYRFKDAFFKAEIMFSDTEPKEKAINYDYNPQAVKMAENALKGLSVSTSNNLVKVKTAKQANHYFNTFLTATITPQYIAKRLSLDISSNTIVVKGITQRITGDANQFLERKVRASQISGGYTLNAIRQGQSYCSCSATNGRLNTSFTSLAEALTPYIRLQDEHIKGIDISNSQFLLLSHLLENCLPTSEKRLINFIYDNGFDSHVLGKQEGKTYEVGELIETLQHIVSRAKKGSDFYEFLDQSFKGTLYDTFAKRQGLSRSAAKTAFFSILFGKCKTSEHAKAFKKEYPSVFEIANKFKAATDYTTLSVFLQKVESLIFINTLLPLCYYSGIQVLTKHDSIYCKASDYKRLMKIVKPFFDSLFGEKIDLK